jgi:hypothetical protein
MVMSRYRRQWIYPDPVRTLNARDEYRIYCRYWFAIDGDTALILAPVSATAVIWFDIGVVVMKEMVSWSSSIMHVFMDSMDNKYGVIHFRFGFGVELVMGSFVMGSMESGVLIGIVMISWNDGSSWSSVLVWIVFGS